MPLFAKFGKKSRNTLESPPSPEVRPASASQAPVRLYAKCPGCNRIVDVDEMASAMEVCPRCGHHTRISARKRIELVCDNGSFVEWDAGLTATDFLAFPGYADKLAAARDKSSERDAVVCGEATVEGMPCAVFVMSPDFMMGSMGAVVGEKVTRLFERAGQRRLPVVGFTVSGGARMQEGTISLMQMAKVSAAVDRFDKAGGLYVTVLCDPTSGGVTASFAMEGDVILAEPGALVAFAGPRVIEQTIHKKLPAGFQSAEFQLDHGFVDAIVDRRRMRDALGMLLAMHADDIGRRAWSGPENEVTGRWNDIARPTRSETGDTESHDPSPVSPGTSVAAAASRAAAAMASMAAAAKDMASNVASRASASALAGGTLYGSAAATSAPTATDVDASAEKSTAQTPPPEKEAGAYERVRYARSAERPTSLALIARVFDSLFELHGDRSFADDDAVVGGIALLGGQPVTVVATERGSDLAERVRRNFGSAHPEGYRKALRLMRQAEKFGRPVVCLVDTSGAYCGIEAEERGQGAAIAANLKAMSGLATPIVSIVIGEGGSGGALGLAVADEVWMLENAVYSVISPEGCASILYKDAARAPEAAEALALTAERLLELGVVDRVVDEGDGSADQIAANLREPLVRKVSELMALPSDELLANRYSKFRAMGVAVIC